MLEKKILLPKRQDKKHKSIKHTNSAYMANIKTLTFTINFNDYA